MYTYIIYISEKNGGSECKMKEDSFNYGGKILVRQCEDESLKFSNV